MAHLAENPGIDWPTYLIAVKVYNQTAHGTYGLSVNPVPDIDIDARECQAPVDRRPNVNVPRN